MKLGRRQREMLEWMSKPACRVYVGFYRAYFEYIDRDIDHAPLCVPESLERRGLVVRKRKDEPPGFGIRNMLLLTDAGRAAIAKAGG